jgi:hypothetical protein
VSRYVVRTMFTPHRHSTSECRLLADQIRRKNRHLHVEVRTPQIALVTEVTAPSAFHAVAMACTRFGRAYHLSNSALVRARRKD